MSDKVWVLVETVSIFRHRYVVEAPSDHPEYAMDTVVMNDAKEFSQTHLDEVINSHRVVTEDEALELFDEDNDYLKDLTREEKIANAFTKVKESV